MTKYCMQMNCNLNLLQLKLWSKGVCVVTMKAAAPPTSSGPLGCLGGHTPSLSVAPTDAGSRPGWLHTSAAPSASGQANTRRIATYLSPSLSSPSLSSPSLSYSPLSPLLPSSLSSPPPDPPSEWPPAVGSCLAGTVAGQGAPGRESRPSVHPPWQPLSVPLIQ